VRGLSFLTKPVSDIALIARVRSLSRLKLMTDEVRSRDGLARIGIRSGREAVARPAAMARSWWSTAGGSRSA
jgi:two-component system cell cycle response regulator